MPTFKWEGLDRTGSAAKGQISARNEKEVRKALRTQGVRIKKVIAPSILETDLGEWMVEKGLGTPFGQKELMRFTKKLGIMINAGVPILPALEVLYQSERNPSLKRTMRELASDVSEGSTIHESLAKKKGFTKFYINMVKSGESAGTLDVVLEKLTEHMERQEKLKSKIKSALTYPAVVVLVGIIVVWILMAYVVPQFIEMLQENAQDIPWVTQFVMDASFFIKDNTLIGIPSVILGFFIFRSIIRTSEGKPIFDKIVMFIPIFGGIIIKGNLSSFARTLSTMLSSGVGLVDALEISTDVVNNEIIVRDLQNVKQRVIEGKDMTGPLTRIPYFPPLVAQMVKVGEQTGSLDQMFLKVSEVFEEEVNELIDNMTKLIEPFIIVVLGGIVAVILVAMYLPMFQSAGGMS